VYHAAGFNAFCVRDPAPMFEVNVRGSENVVRAAAQAGVERVVYTSSAASLGERKGTVGSEESPHRGSFLSAYERSKFEAERADPHARPRLRRDKGRPRARSPLHADRGNASADDRLVGGAGPVVFHGEGHSVESRWLG